MEELTSASAVISELGGVSAVAKLTRRKYSAAWNWKDIGSFPSNTYGALTDALREKGKSAPRSLFRMVEPTQ